MNEAQLPGAHVRAVPGGNLKEENVPWIESHLELETHPKTIDLMSLMKWDLDRTLGKLHRFWWWCLKYALDGDLRKHNPIRLGAAVGLSGPDCEKFVEAMKDAGFFDREPYFRVHDWWTFVRWYLKGSRFKQEPEKWQAIQALYTPGEPPPSSGPLNPNKPNLTKPTKPEERIYAASGSQNDPLPTSTSPATDLIVLTFPCKGMGPKEWHLRESKLKEYQEAFPALDIRSVTRHARQWCIDNPTKRKTHRGMPAFLTRWLGRDQDRGGSRNGKDNGKITIPTPTGKYEHLRKGGALPKMPEKVA